ncbi:MAG: hypothetical protein M1281_15130 [Chloroflexi bacterium]|nr:hypothetical protein [Chloroflexota bacterium]
MSPFTDQRKCVIPQKTIAKAPGLLPMLYTVAELAADLCVPDRTLRDWLAVGAPHTRDSKSHIWIEGTAFYEWLASQRKPKKTEKLDDNQEWWLSKTRLNRDTRPIFRRSTDREGALMSTRITFSRVFGEKGMSRRPKLTTQFDTI